MDQSLHTLGGALWINLANTLRRQPGRKPSEGLADALEDERSARDWLIANGLGPDADEAPLAGEPLHRMLAALTALRADCLALLGDLALGGGPSDAVMQRLAERAASLAVRPRLDRTAGGFSLDAEGATPADDAAFRVIRSIGESLAAYEPDRFRQCGHENCVLHFVDTSKSGRRRWCSMDRCGNRRKAADFYAKKAARRG